MDRLNSRLNTTEEIVNWKIDLKKSFAIAQHREKNMNKRKKRHGI